MKIRYDTLLDFAPIPVHYDGKLIGHAKKPVLDDIAKLGWERFEMYESFLKMSPKLLFTTLSKDGDKAWKELDDSVKEKLTLYDILVMREDIMLFYLDILQFFFVESIVYASGSLILLKQDYQGEDITLDDVVGMITKESFPDVLSVLQQVCCIYDDSKDKVENLKFKNKLAEELYKKMYGDDEEEEDSKPKQKKVDKNLTLANIISTVASNHHSLNFTNIYQITIPQLYDSFQKLQRREMYDLDKRRVSVWGDSDRKFDFSSWYKNEYD